MAVSDKEISIGIVILTLILLGAWIAIFYVMKSNQVGLFTPYVPPGMEVSYDDDGNGGVPGGSSGATKQPIYSPDPSSTLGYYYPLGVQGFAGDSELCSRKSVFTQGYDMFVNGPNKDAHLSSGYPIPKPSHWMKCLQCNGPDWMIPASAEMPSLPNGGTVDDLYNAVFPNHVCQQPAE
jgi:hypothetical protein